MDRRLHVYEPAPESPHSTYLGRGRSGVVFRVVEDTANDPAGAVDTDSPQSDHERPRELAVKVFTGEALSKLIHYIFGGAPNPYGWNEDAVHCAVLRRHLLAELVEFWFDGKLRVARAIGSRWNARQRAFELRTQFVTGRTATLHQPFSAGRDAELAHLVGRVMKPLQQRLTDAGFDGLVWQAGKGNPVATNNFLFCKTPDDAHCWAWIDLESGVPALFPLNPLVLATFYLPRSFKHGRPLFDDVDIERLRRYIAVRQESIEQRLGRQRLYTIISHVDQLQRAQSRWRSLPRTHRSISYQLSQGRIDPTQAEYYRRHPLRWCLHEAARIARRLPSQVTSVAQRIVGRLKRVNVRWLVTSTWLLQTSQKYRAAVARRYVHRRIRRWEQRRHLSQPEAASLATMLRGDEASSYLTDFGMHLALKPYVKLLQVAVVVPLAAMGLISPPLAAFLVACGGAIGRTVYTVGRLMQATFDRRPKPWVALATGGLPVVGNVAFPLQVIYTGTGRRDKLAQFIVYDCCTRVGELLPIWGGPDTQTEHWFNRLGDWVVRDRAPLVEAAGAEQDGQQHVLPLTAVHGSHSSPLRRAG